MMMTSGGKLPRWGLASWFQGNGPLLLFSFLAGQAITALLWGANITARLETIERRGSAAVATLASEMQAVHQWQANHDKVSSSTHTAQRLAEHEAKLSVIEERDRTLLDILKQNAIMLSKINDELTRHLIDGNGKNNKN